jgi:hypothetical protein
VLTRRRFVKLVSGGATALAVLPQVGCGDNLHLVRGRFFDEAAWQTIDIATGLILPGEHGARDCLAVNYIDQLLSAFDVDPPAIYASGPFSGRVPYPDAHGAATSQFPANAFATFLPLSRVKAIAWRMRLYGSAVTDGGTFNDAVFGPTIGWRELYADGIKRLDDQAMIIRANTPFRFLEDPADQEQALDTVASDQPDFWDALLQHTLEGTFGAPEYGGNLYARGWHMARYDGDSAPRGHATYDEAQGMYVDRLDQPTSQPSQGDVTEDFDADILDLLTVAALGSGGKRFF